jgi:mannose-1-phosphate guanylyltransferase
VAAILAGGQSSRLFPFNKVLADLTGSGRTLLQQAYDRLKFFPKGRIYALTTQEMAAPVRRQLKLSASRVLVDPVRRGTWPAILWAMAHLRRESPDAVMAVLTGDHVIRNDKAFVQELRRAVDLARAEPAVVLVGIPPRACPEEWRGFGCFRADESGRVTQFQEKPSAPEVRRMMGEGGWLWNSGMFFFRISTAEAALQRLQPEMNRVYEAVAKAVALGKKAEAAFLYEDFHDKIPHPLDPGRYVDNSIDYAILTPLVGRSVTGLEARAIRGVRFRWTDLGQWDALRMILKPDHRGNIRVGKTVLKGDVRDSILVVEKGRTIEFDGVQDLIAAFAGRTALILSSSSISQVKEVAQEALRHPNRVVMEHNVTGSDIRASGGRVAAIGLSGLSIELKGTRLVVSSKRCFIP